MTALRFAVWFVAPIVGACAAPATPGHSFTQSEPAGSTAATRAAPAGRSTTTDGTLALDVALGQPVMAAGRLQTGYVEVALTGQAQDRTDRAPVNIALVLDRSGSMQGDKLLQAKLAAQMVLDQLEPDDMISVITYSSNADVLIPPMRVDEARKKRDAIERVSARGSTALYDGVTTGLAQVGAGFDKKRVNRIILLSDGEANVGPSSPADLGSLGAEAARQGIAITTIGLGLGYNEDLMAQLAQRSEGSHAFAETSTELAAIFEHELSDVMSVVSQDVAVEIEFGDGVVPVRAIGRDAVIDGGKAKVAIGQLYASQEKHVVFEVRVPEGTAGGALEVASVGVHYTDAATAEAMVLHGAASVGFSADDKAIATGENKAVMAAVVEAIGTDNNVRAVAMRDAGQIDEARQLLQDNAIYLQREGERLGSQGLQDYGTSNAGDARNLEGDRWNAQRKSMREQQYVNNYQRGW